MFIIEGGDYAGKTTLVNALNKSGISDVIDREKSISKEIILNKSIDKIVKAIYDLILTRYIKDEIYILYNCNKKEIARRISLRGVQDEYDKHAYEYNILYKNVFTKLSKTLKNIHLVNTDVVTIENILKEVNSWKSKK